MSVFVEMLMIQIYEQPLNTTSMEAEMARDLILWCILGYIKLASRTPGNRILYVSRGSSYCVHSTKSHQGHFIKIPGICSVMHIGALVPIGLKGGTTINLLPVYSVRAQRSNPQLFRSLHRLTYATKTTFPLSVTSD